jgi:tetratricopeptide (TPR) repeat protein
VKTRVAAGEVLLDRFALVRELGVSGPTRLWLAEDRNFGEPVAVHVLELWRAPSDADRERMRDAMRDACRQARQLAHPRILRVFDFHADRDICLITREYADGSDVNNLAGHPHHEIVRAVLPIVDALDYAHAHGIVHGNLKQSKIVGGSAGGWRLADFGITSGLQSSSTPTPSEDVHALGVLLRSLITDAGPPGAHATPAGLATVLGRMVDAPSPSADALQTMRAVRAALEPFATPPRTEDLVVPATASLAAPPPVEDSREDFATIKPVSFRLESPPAAATATDPLPTSSRRQRLPAWTVAAFGVLAAMVVAVFLYLPDWVASRRAAVDDTSDTQITAGEPAPRDQAPAVETPVAAPSDTVKRLLVDVITRYDELERRGADQWAGVDFRKAGEQRLQGENAMQRGEEARSIELLEASLEILVSLQRRQPDVLAEVLERGAAALAAGDQAGAAREFALALTIDPQNAPALQGAARAGNLNEVLALMRVGADAEQAGKLTEARQAYAEAAKLDPLFAPAGEGLTRIDTALADETYTQQMALAVKAVARGDLTEAEAAYRAALGARPDSREARAGLTHVERTRRSQRIQHHRRLAKRAEHDEDWGTAATHHRAVLDLDAGDADARRGFERDRKLEKLTNRMTALIESPRMLHDPATLAEAHVLLATAERLASDSSRVVALTTRLSALVAEASTPVRVVLQSDGRTDVSVQRVGRLGAFERRELLLRPGTYVIRGTRRGYRDVRQTITIAPGNAAPTVRIRCSEQI